MKNQSLVTKLGFALSGFSYAVRQEHNMRRHIVVALITLAVFAWLQPSPIWWALIILCIALVLAAELVNSAVEALIDHIHPQRHEQIKNIKDMLAAMVLVLSIGSAIVGVLAIYSTL